MRAFGKISRGDLYGGMTAAVIALPLALAFGVTAVSPLGPELASMGALVGLLGAMFTGFIAAWHGGTPAQITGPTGPMTAVVTLFIASSFVGRAPEDVPLVMTLTAFAIALGGAMQIAIGWIGGGKLVRYIPYPVVAGFMNGIAVIIFLGQIKPFLGVTGAFSEFEISTAWVPIVIGTMTIGAILMTKRVSKTLPGSLVGLFAGIAVYFVIAAFGYAPLHADNNTLVVGPIPNPFTSFDHLPLLQLGSLGDISPLDARRVISTAITLAVLGSIDSLLTSVIADVVTNTRHDSRKELIGQGLGNVTSGLLGGLAGAGATVRTLVNVNAGGRTRHSGMIHSAVILVVVLALGNPAGWIPQATLAGILFVTAYGIIDRYSLGLFRRRLVRNEFVLMLVVASVTVAVDLMIAVAIGIATAAMLFIVQQSKTGVMVRRLRGNEVFSRRHRSPAHMAILANHGAGSVAYQISGALFFGTTDAVLSEIDADTEPTRRVILDVTKVRDIDLSGIQLLLQLLDRLRDQGKQVAICGLTTMEASRTGLHKMLVELGVFEKAGKQHVHPSLDRALEVFEDQLLAEHDQPASMTPLELASYDAVSQLSAVQLGQLSPLLIERDLAAGELLFEADAPADCVAFVRAGRLALIVKTSLGETRLAVFGRGEIYGARAFFEDARWQSALRAEERSSVFLLPRSALQSLRTQHPDVLAFLQSSLLRSTVTRMDALRSELVVVDES